MKILWILLISLLSFYGMAESSMHIYDLQCEYQTAPLGIDTETPRFCWKLSDNAQIRGQRQTAYRLLIASSPALLDQDKGDIWDSGTISSDQSTLIAYKGKKLVSDQTYYWKVRAFDKDNKATGWSPTASFSTGLFSSSDWKSLWIKHPEAPAEQHIWFRKSFSLAQPAEKALFHIASMGYHELYVNGKKADDRVLAPALTRLDKRVLYVTYDITRLLENGSNTIAIWFGPGWARYNYFSGSIHPALRAQTDIRTKDGNLLSIRTDNSWKCSTSNSRNTGKYQYSDMGGECVDGRKYETDWNKPAFDDSQWQTAEETSLNVTLSAQMMEPSRIIETLPAQKIIDTIPGIYKVDMGKNFTGWLDIKMNGMAAGDTVVIKVADDPETLQDFGQRNLYICRGESGEFFRNRFNFIAGRYINIEGLKQMPHTSDIKGYVIATDLKRNGYFNCSDDLFNRIYETDLWTYRMCTTEGYTSDCPHRERLGYGEVAFATAWGIALPNYRSAAYLAKHVRDWTDVQEWTGWIHHTAPQINEHYGGPMWSSAGLNISWEYYLTYGDKRILETVYSSAKQWLEYLYQHSAWGLLEAYAGGGKFLGDWAAPKQRKEFGGTPESFFFNNCVYAMNLETVAQIADRLEKPEEAVLYRKRLTALKKKIQSQFFDKETGLYMEGNQVQTAFPLWRKITPDSLYTTVLSHFEEEFIRNHPYLDMGSSGLPVLLKFLTEEHTYNETMAQRLSDTNQPSYGYFLKRGETTWPEYWNVDVPSRIHTCYTGIASWFIKCVGGIRPDPAHPGYQQFIIKPSPVDCLKFARTETESLYGTIKSEWIKKDNLLKLDISIPVNTQATVYLPSKGSTLIRENGKPLASSEGITILEETGKECIVKVESGHYSFTMKKNN